MEQLGYYTLSSPMTNKDSGFSVWCFGQRDGQEYFIKEFLSPKYPFEDPHAPQELIARKKKDCEDFEIQKRRLYSTLNQYSDGNSVRVRDFFRVETKYYVAMPKVNAQNLSIAFIAAMPESEQRRLCAIIAHAVASFHNGGLIHGDIKPNNILFTQLPSGYYTAKIIDFDSSFLESEPPQDGEEIVGDQIYFSPEAWLVTYGYEAALTCKMDVFALGILFHQYFTGELPTFDPEAEYAGKAVAQGMELTLSPRLPRDLRPLIGRMLEANPTQRISAMEVFRALTPAPVVTPPRPAPYEYGTGRTPAQPNPNGVGMNKWFNSAGDL